MRYDVLIIEPLKEVLVRVAGFVPTLLLALGILIVGCIVVHLVIRGLEFVLKTIGFDKMFDMIGITPFLKNGGIKHKPSELLSVLLTWVLNVSVVFMTITTLGLTIGADLIDTIFAYVPTVIHGVMVLIFGMIIARFTSKMVHFVATVTEMPRADVVSKLSKWAILVYVTIMFLKDVGLSSLVSGEYLSTLVMGIVFAFSLALGLAGKDIIAGYLEVFKRK